MDRASASATKITLASIVVFSVAVTLRIPSCYESFWVDELHTAWVIWDTFGEVTPRAILGHQSPFYFAGMWVWKQLVGSSELALRLSSVFAVALSGVVLTAGIARWTGSLLAGVVAGMLIATETNSLFFGTELRPYAMVMLLASISLVLFLSLLFERSRHHQSWKWLGLHAAIIFAILCQPTAAGLMLLPAALVANWLIREPRTLARIKVSDAIILIGGSLTGLALWNVTLNQSWQQRNAWRSFASATNWQQISSMWDWKWLWIAPLIVMLIAVAIAAANHQFGRIRSLTLAALTMASAAPLMTSIYWWVSWMDWVPVWHRRYFVSVLPMFACLSGIAVATLHCALKHVAEKRTTQKPGSESSASWKWQIVPMIASAALIIVVPAQQGSLRRLPGYPVALVVRGEDWRNTMQWVHSNSHPDDVIYLDAGLIENETWLAHIDPNFPEGESETAQIEFLNYVAAGPYPLNRKSVPFNHLEVASGDGHRSVLSPEIASHRQFTILRKPSNRIKKEQLPNDATVKSFGNVTVILQRNAFDQISPTSKGIGEKKRN
jgi:mannosyltransferase